MLYYTAEWTKLWGCWKYNKGDNLLISGSELDEAQHKTFKKSNKLDQIFNIGVRSLPDIDDKCEDLQTFINFSSFFFAKIVVNFSLNMLFFWLDAQNSWFSEDSMNVSFHNKFLQLDFSNNNKTYGYSYCKWFSKIKLVHVNPKNQEALLCVDSNIDLDNGFKQFENTTQKNLIFKKKIAFSIN